MMRDELRVGDAPIASHHSLRVTVCLIFKNLEEVKCVGPREARARVLGAAGKNEAPDMGCDCIERTPLLTSGGVRSQANRL